MLKEILSLNIFDLVAIYFDLAIFENQEILKNLWDATWNENN